ncbi:hypothetical protein FNV43_RR14658 [Rhamnella rubrinervis]|uniref:DUF4283 domain-containing protein n=1 Tax=Rhamnella rubrinervis TaxID=2594499 RepID=A0A8K0MGK3_9ROSA|nr:hypothetical protein FNV43_RR14658 [Rhamnella rubrinervis]
MYDRSFRNGRCRLPRIGLLYAPSRRLGKPGLGRRKTVWQLRNCSHLRILRAVWELKLKDGLPVLVVECWPTTRLSASSSPTLLVFSGFLPRHFPPTSMEEINSSLEHMKFFMDADDNDIDTRQNLKFCMFGKLFSDKSPNLAALFKVMKKSWNPSRGVELQELENGVLVFQFFCEADIRRVEQTGPWCFNGNILLLHRWEPEVSPYEISFKETTIWVQFLGLLLEWYTPQFVRKLGMNIGEVLEIDLGKNHSSDFKAAKARIKFNLENPLKPESLLPLTPMSHRDSDSTGEEGPLAMVIFGTDTSNRKTRSDAGDLRRNGGGWWTTSKQCEHGESEALVIDPFTPLTTKVPLSQSYKPSQRERFLEAARRKQEDGSHQNQPRTQHLLEIFSEVEPMDISVRTQDGLRGLTGEARSKEEKSGIQLATQRLEALKGMDNGLGLGVKPNSLKVDMDLIKSTGLRKFDYTTIQPGQKLKPTHFESKTPEGPLNPCVANIIDQEPIPLTSPALHVENYPASYSASQGKIEDVCSSSVISSLSKHGKRHLNGNKTSRSIKRRDNRYGRYHEKFELKTSATICLTMMILRMFKSREGHIRKGEASLKMPSSLMKTLRLGYGGWGIPNDSIIDGHLLPSKSSTSVPY